MNTFKTLIAASALTASVVAGAAVTPLPTTATAPAGSSFLSLSTDGLAGVATLSGGTVYGSSVMDVALEPLGTSGNFLAAGASSATLTFLNGGVSSIGFMWGSPDTYNLLSVTSTGSPTQTFTALSLGLTPDGSVGASEYVTFAGIAGSMITSITFSNTNGQPAFEASNFTSPVPEPETYALLFGGLGAIGFIARRRQSR